MSSLAAEPGFEGGRVPPKNWAVAGTMGLLNLETDPSEWCFSPKMSAHSLTAGHSQHAEVGVGKKHAHLLFAAPPCGSADGSGARGFSTEIIPGFFPVPGWVNSCAPLLATGWGSWHGTQREKGPVRFRDGEGGVGRVPWTKSSFLCERETHREVQISLALCHLAGRLQPWGASLGAPAGSGTNLIQSRQISGKCLWGLSTSVSAWPGPGTLRY